MNATLIAIRMRKNYLVKVCGGTTEDDETHENKQWKETISFRFTIFTFLSPTHRSIAKIRSRCWLDFGVFPLFGLQKDSCIFLFLCCSFIPRFFGVLSSLEQNLGQERED